MHPLPVIEPRQDTKHHCTQQHLAINDAFTSESLPPHKLFRGHPMFLLLLQTLPIQLATLGSQCWL
jgi:hypothetical protein